MQIQYFSLHSAGHQEKKLKNGSHLIILGKQDLTEGLVLYIKTKKRKDHITAH